MKTKDRILLTALELFNENGIDTITVRHIAKAMGISHGNLCYHFAKKEDIILQLYLDLVQELDDQFQALQRESIGLRLVLESVRLTFRIQYKYKFLLTDFVSIMRFIPAIQSHFKTLFLRRKQELAHITQDLIKAGYFQEEQFYGQYELFITQFYIIGDFWIAEAEILFEGSDEEKLTYYSHIAYGAVFPYLTEKGKIEFKEIVGS